VKGDGISLFFCADLIPTSAHIPPSWRMSYDNYPLIIYREKEEYLVKAMKENWILFFEHDPAIAAATVRQDDKGVVAGKHIAV
jgi:hypothetical protein